VEVLEFITVLSVLGVVAGTIIVMLLRVIPRKTTKRVAEDNLTRLLTANSRLTEEYEKRQQALLKSVQSENNRLRKELSPVDEDGEPIKENVPWEVIAAGAEQMGIPSAMLIPFKKQILQYTKGMSIEEIQQSAGSIKGLLGGKGSGQNTQNQSDGTQFA